MESIQGNGVGFINQMINRLVSEYKEKDEDFESFIDEKSGFASLLFKEGVQKTEGGDEERVIEVKAEMTAEIEEDMKKIVGETEIEEYLTGNRIKSFGQIIELISIVEKENSKTIEELSDRIKEIEKSVYEFENNNKDKREFKEDIEKNIEWFARKTGAEIEGKGESVRKEPQEFKFEKSETKVESNDKEMSEREVLIVQSEEVKNEMKKLAKEKDWENIEIRKKGAEIINKEEEVRMNIEIEQLPKSEIDILGKLFKASNEEGYYDIDGEKADFVDTVVSYLSNQVSTNVGEVSEKDERNNNRINPDDKFRNNKGETRYIVNFNKSAGENKTTNSVNIKHIELSNTSGVERTNLEYRMFGQGQGEKTVANQIKGNIPVKTGEVNQIKVELRADKIGMVDIDIEKQESRIIVHVRTEGKLGEEIMEKIMQSLKDEMEEEGEELEYYIESDSDEEEEDFEEILREWFKEE